MSVSKWILRLTAICLCWMGLGLPGEAVSQQAPEVSFTVDRFEVEGDNPLSAKKTRNVLSAFTGAQNNLDGLLGARQALEDAIVASGSPFHRVVLPPQTLKARVVTLQVIAFRVGTIDIFGNEFFDETNIRRSLPDLAEGTAPNTRRLARQIQMINSHPSKDVRVKFQESRIPDQIDASVELEDSSPHIVFGSLNNTGTEQSGDLRLSLGYQYNNLFNRDHVATISYTTSPDEFDDVSQYGINYSAPLYSFGGTVSGFFTDSSVDSGLIADTFNVTGEGQAYGASFARPFLNRGAYTHGLTVGVQNKEFDSAVTFTGLPVDNTNVVSRPFFVKYNGGHRGVSTGGRFSVSAAINIPGGSNNDDTSYRAARAGADSDWYALRFDSFGDYFFKNDWQLHGQVSGQYAGQPLIAGEQFGLGGVDTVRGYEEREVLADNGLLFRGEVWTPAYTQAGFRALAFVDAGLQDVEDSLPGQADSDTPSSVGLGFRYAWRRTLNLSLDLGSALSRAGSTQSGDFKAHFNLFFRF